MTAPILIQFVQYLSTTTCLLVYVVSYVCFPVCTKILCRLTFTSLHTRDGGRGYVHMKRFNGVGRGASRLLQEDYETVRSPNYWCRRARASLSQTQPWLRTSPYSDTHYAPNSQYSITILSKFTLIQSHDVSQPRRIAFCMQCEQCSAMLGPHTVPYPSSAKRYWQTYWQMSGGGVTERTT